MSLDEKDRALVAGVPVKSSEAEPDVVEAWVVEIRRRVEELESGSVEPIPWSEVRQRLFQGFER
jgi:hypothetical protein